MAANNIIISINTKMTIKMFATNNRIIIKESFAQIKINRYFDCDFDFTSKSEPTITNDRWSFASQLLSLKSSSCLKSSKITELSRIKLLPR